jgi:hypothetical protein
LVLVYIYTLHLFGCCNYQWVLAWDTIHGVLSKTQNYGSLFSIVEIISQMDFLHPQSMSDGACHSSPLHAVSWPFFARNKSPYHSSVDVQQHLTT